MITHDREFVLVKDGEVLGTLKPDGGDFPWVQCTFQPTEHFEPYRKMFDEQAEALEVMDDIRVSRALDQIYALGFVVSAKDGTSQLRVQALNISGGRACFR